MAKMPILLNVDHLLQSLESQEERDIVKAIIGQQNRLRSSKPKLDSDINRLASYVWRIVAFQISPNSQHHCIPMTAEFDLPAKYWPSGFPTYSDFNDPNRVLTEYEIGAEKARIARKEKIAQLNILIDKIVNTVPKSEWKGVIRWGRALGQL